MILYTPLPEDLIMQQENKAGGKAEYIPISHGLLEVNKSGQDYVVSRVISTDLKCYLNPEYSPGFVIKRK